MPRHNYLSQSQKTSDPITAKLIGWFLAPFICAWLLVWYNYVLIRLPINYWQWVAIAVAFMLFPKWLKHPIGGFLGAVALMCQVLYWVGLIALPVFHL